MLTVGFKAKAVQMAIGRGLWDHNCLMHRLTRCGSPAFFGNEAPSKGGAQISIKQTYWVRFNRFQRRDGFERVKGSFLFRLLDPPPPALPLLAEVAPGVQLQQRPCRGRPQRREN
ncbi:Hypothetical predicted protein [Podarcis lilfordi]|uniref:Uncharacterized protein n=1 Tax=Podarcis lilfordi TaxID=74358 RepID=A0AA35JYW9_9SAUR|nr:Hypothetical predicted protein [Podarcis lilfordi]